MIHQPATAEDWLKECGGGKPTQLWSSMKIHCRNTPRLSSIFPPPYPPHPTAASSKASSPSSHHCCGSCWDFCPTHRLCPPSLIPYHHHQPPQERGQSPESVGEKPAALLCAQLSNSREIAVHLCKTSPFCSALPAWTCYMEGNGGKRRQKEWQGLRGPD